VVRVKVAEVAPASRPEPATVNVVEVAAVLVTLMVKAPVAVTVSPSAVADRSGDADLPCEIPSAWVLPNVTVAAVATVVPDAADTWLAPFVVQRRAVVVVVSVGTFPPTR